MVVPGPLADVLSQLVVGPLLVRQASHHGKLGDEEDMLVLKASLNIEILLFLQKQ